MATTPVTITSNDVTTEGPDGKNVGATTKAARKGAVEGGAIGTLLAYILVKTGLEADAATAAVVAGALATVIAAVLAHFEGKRTPTDQARTERHVETRTVVAPGPTSVPAVEIGPDGVPATAGSSSVAPSPLVIPDGNGEHRAETPKGGV